MKNSNFRGDHNSEDRWQPRGKFPWGLSGATDFSAYDPLLALAVASTVETTLSARKWDFRGTSISDFFNNICAFETFERRPSRRQPDIADSGRGRRSWADRPFRRCWSHGRRSARCSWMRRGNGRRRNVARILHHVRHEIAEDGIFQLVEIDVSLPDLARAPHPAAHRRRARPLRVRSDDEGVDDRVIEARGPIEVSIGDYMLSGGEIAVLAVLNACVRLIPSVMGKEESGAMKASNPACLSITTSRDRANGRAAPFPMCCSRAITPRSPNGGGRRQSGPRGRDGRTWRPARKALTRPRMGLMLLT